MDTDVLTRFDGNRAAIIVEPDLHVVTFAELEARSNQIAHYLREAGLRPGDRIGIMSENSAEYLEIAWGAQRAGLYYVGINTHLTAPEVSYLVGDSGVHVLFVSARFVDLAENVLTAPNLQPRRIVIGDRCEGWECYADILTSYPTTPIDDECEGDFLLYSSGTTGQPKGIKRPLPGGPMGTYSDLPGRWLRETLGFNPGDVYLSPAPLYHAAPLAWSMSTHRSGGTAVILRNFDPELSLRTLEKHEVTHSQWVPTMFVRMLKLPEKVRTGYDLSSLRHVIHGAAPCPVEVKHRMIEWLGPILYEFYSSTEGMGATAITSEQWLLKPGSVGLPVMGTPYIKDEDGNTLPAGEVGTIWFTGCEQFEYHGDPLKTAASRDSSGGVTVGDLGYLDEDGYLFLSDRRPHLIISGGVNIYPQEIEDALVLHPRILDVGVIGFPDQEMGERLVAVVQPVSKDDVEGLAEDLRAYVRERLAGFKVPREFRIVDELPRTPTGKLRKHELRDQVVAPELAGGTVLTQWPRTFDGIRVDVTDRVATLTLDREKHRNAWTIPMVRAFSDALRRCAHDDEIRVVVLTGAGDSFSVGADLAAGLEPSSDTATNPSDVLQNLFTPRDLDKPVIAAINGDAIGMGVTLSLLCDIRIVAIDARLAIPMTRLGIIPELGSHWTLPRIAGLAVASDLLLTGRRFSGAEAERLGVCSHAVPRGEVLERALETAKDIANHTAPRAVGLAKRLMLDSLETSYGPSFARESDLFVALAREPDATEGVNAFLEKRAPRWTGSVNRPLPQVGLSDFSE